MNKNVIITQSNAEPYSMPAIEEDCTGRNRRRVRQTAEDIQRKAYEEGFSSGEKAGLEEGKNKAVLLIDRLEKMISDLADVKAGMTSGLESDVIDLSVVIAKKIIESEIRTRPEVLVGVVKEALRKLQGRDSIIIKINPALYDLFMEKKPELMDIHEDISFDVNNNLPLSGPLVISETEEVVTDIDSQISNIVDAMKDGTHSMEVSDSSCNNDTESDQKPVQETGTEVSDQTDSADKSDRED